MVEVKAPRLRGVLVALAVAALLALAGAQAARSGPQAHAADRDCPDFPNQAAAQAYFLSHGGPARDPDRLDADHDGIACQSLPCPCSRSGSGGGGGGTKGRKGPRCGVERWAVKTLSDRAARSVRFRPRRTSVDALRAKRAPDLGPGTPRLRGAERTTYRVKARLLEAKREDDRDIHLVIADPSNRRHTMIVELPDTRCQGARRSPKKRAMRKARAAFVRACGSPGSGSFTPLRGTATITGVGFFDLLHGQTGVAPNGIELHPVLGFRARGCR